MEVDGDDSQIGDAYEGLSVLAANDDANKQALEENKTVTWNGRSIDHKTNIAGDNKIIQIVAHSSNSKEKTGSSDRYEVNGKNTNAPGGYNSKGVQGSFSHTDRYNDGTSSTWGATGSYSRDSNGRSETTGGGFFEKHY